MIKKLIFATIIFLSLLTPVSSFAMEYTFGEVGGLSDLGYGLSLGAEFDFENSKYTIKDIQNLTLQQIQAKAEENARAWLYDYCFSRQIPLPDSETELPVDVYSYFKSYYFGKNVQKMFNNYQVELYQGSLNADATLRMPISRQAISDWSQYRSNAYQRYKDMFYEESDQIVPNPNTEYADLYNLTYFWQIIHQPNSSIVVPDVFNAPTQNDYSGNYFVWYNRTEHTYYRNNWNDSPYNWYYTSDTNPVYALSEYININIVTTGNGTVIISLPALTWDNTVFRNSYLYGQGYKYYGWKMAYNGSTIRASNWQSVDTAPSISVPQSFNNIRSALNWVETHFKNFSLTVDGELWVDNQLPDVPSPVIPDFPDIINPDSDDPIDLVDLPNTTNYEGTFDITSLFDAIKEAIIGASDSDNTTSGILDNTAIKEGFRDEAGELVGDAVIPLANIIDDSFPIQDTDNYPTIPMPDQPIHDAFLGTTILAQLILACETVFPQELIIVFWGIVFILFIIGLIKVLHK